jgi:hypothetical protein
MIDASVLSKLLGVLRPDTNLTQKSAKLLALDLRKAAAACDKLSLEGVSDVSDKLAPLAKRHKSNFDFTKYHKRYVVLRLFYIGWNYHGFSSQDHDKNTVEGHIFRSLERTCLLPQNSVWSEIRYCRCGRTDVGVSAASQVVALTLRSKAKVGEPLPGPSEELDYPSIVNRVLPDDIQVTGWAPAEPDFHARFSCIYREYIYFMPGTFSHLWDRLTVRSVVGMGGISCRGCRQSFHLSQRYFCIRCITSVAQTVQIAQPVSVLYRLEVGSLCTYICEWVRQHTVTPDTGRLASMGFCDTLLSLCIAFALDELIRAQARVRGPVSHVQSQTFLCGFISCVVCGLSGCASGMTSPHFPGPYAFSHSLPLIMTQHFVGSYKMQESRSDVQVV